MSKVHILLADNDSDYRESVRRLLETADFLVTAVHSVEAAIEKLETRNWDLVMTDWRLTNDDDDQDQSGIEVLKKATERNIPCIIISAYGTLNAVRWVLRNSSAIDFVPKEEGGTAILASIQQLYGITLLHISDLHPKVPASGEVPYDQEQAYSKFLADVLDQPGLGLNPLRAVLVSGDISLHNHNESFDWARHYLMDLSAKLSIPPDRFVITPGNHDINRLNARHTPDSLQAMRSADLTWFTKYDKYLDFTRHFYGEPAFTPGKLYRLFMIENQVAIAAFNSCLVEGDSKWKCPFCFRTTAKEHYMGWIDRHQVMQAGAELGAMNWSGLRIGMFHHHIVSEEHNPPPDVCQGDHLWPYHQSEQRLNLTFFEQEFKILLHGHRHKLELKQPQTLGSNAPVNLGSGAFWPVNEDEQETVNYLLLQLPPIAGKSRVIMRKYFPASVDRPGYWGTDNSIRPDGIIPLPGIVLPTVQSE